MEGELFVEGYHGIYLIRTLHLNTHMAMFEVMFFYQKSDKIGRNSTILVSFSKSLKFV